jgi:Dna[CI] antecedent, DciA
MQSARHDFGKLATRILKDAPIEESVLLAWPLACGSTVAERTQALSFADGTLCIHVPDDGWEGQLEGFSPLYRQKLGQLSGHAVIRIVYTTTRQPGPENRLSQ